MSQIFEHDMRGLRQQDLLSDIPLKAKASARRKAAAKEFVVEDIAYSLGRGVAVQSDLIKRNGSDCAVVVRREHKNYYVELDGQRIEGSFWSAQEAVIFGKEEAKKLLGKRTAR